MTSVIDFSVIDCQAVDMFSINEMKFLRKLDLKINHKAPNSSMVIERYGIKHFKLTFQNDTYIFDKIYHNKLDMFRDLDRFFRNLRYVNHQLNRNEYFTSILQRDNNFVVMS